MQDIQWQASFSTQSPALILRGAYLYKLNDVMAFVEKENS